MSQKFMPIVMSSIFNVLFEVLALAVLEIAAILRTSILGLIYLERKWLVWRLFQLLFILRGRFWIISSACLLTSWFLSLRI